MGVGAKGLVPLGGGCSPAGGCRHGASWSAGEGVVRGAPARRGCPRSGRESMRCGGLSGERCWSVTVSGIGGAGGCGCSWWSTCRGHRPGGHLAHARRAVPRRPLACSAADVRLVASGGCVGRLDEPTLPSSAPRSRRAETSTLTRQCVGSRQAGRVHARPPGSHWSGLVGMYRAATPGAWVVGRGRRRPAHRGHRDARRSGGVALGPDSVTGVWLSRRTRRKYPDKSGGGGGGGRVGVPGWGLVCWSGLGVAVGAGVPVRRN